MIPSHPFVSASRFLSIVAVAFLLSSCQTTASKPCVPDNISRVDGNGECLVMKAFGNATTVDTMVIFIHGDGSGGGASDYLYSRAQRYGTGNVLGVGLIRPGYFDSYGNTSEGQNYRYDGDGYKPHIVDAVAGAVKNLKAHYKVKRVFLVGHSGGAAISGVILGRFPELVDSAVLAACPCHVPDWRIMRRGQNSWTQSLSPHEFAAAIPTSAKVIAITGSNDSNTQPVIAREYVETLKARGLDASFIDVPGTSHNGVTKVEAFYAAIDVLLR